MSQLTFIITLIANDKPGIVNTLAQCIKDHKGNWHKSHVIQLANKFAGVITATIPAVHSDEFQQALKNLEAQGITTLVDSVDEDLTGNNGNIPFEISGPDRSGIVHEISQAFHQHNINIDEMETDCSSAPWSGEPLFSANGLLLAPKNWQPGELEEQLRLIEDKLGVDINLDLIPAH